MTRLLLLTALLFSSNTLINAQECHQILKPRPYKELYVKIGRITNPQTKSKDLSDVEKLFIKALIPQLEEISRSYEQARTNLLLKYPPSFLPRVREKLRAIGDDFRAYNQRIADELTRYLQDQGDLRFSDLEFGNIRDHHIDQALAFIKNPESLQFGLGYFMDSYFPKTQKTGQKKLEYQSAEGYIWGEEPLHILKRSTSLVKVVSESAQNPDTDYYPTSNILIPSKNEDDGLSFSGLPLTKEVLDFLSRYGVKNGHIALSYNLKLPKNRFKEHLLLRDRARNFSRHQPRWSTLDQRYAPLLNPQGVLNPALSIADNYEFKKGTFFLPYLQARHASREELKSFNANLGTFISRGFFFSNTTQEILVSEETIEDVEFIVFPTHKEFITALIQIIYEEALLNQ